MTREKAARYHHGSLRQALIEAAVEEIGRAGVETVNLRRLAARIGVTSGAPYHHFADREALLRGIADEGFARLMGELVKASDAHPEDPGARLETLGLAYMRFAIANPGYFRVMFHGESLTSGPIEAGLSAFRLLADVIIACQKTGAAPAGDPAPLVLTAWSTVHGFATLWVDRALPFAGMDPARMAPEIGRMVVAMFAAVARHGGDAPSELHSAAYPSGRASPEHDA
jgi:AcrR family transcriptional regulator